jgi:hypothetical protein
MKDTIACAFRTILALAALFLLGELLRRHPGALFIAALAPVAVGLIAVTAALLQRDHR